MDIDIQFKNGLHKLFSADWVGREHNLIVIRNTDRSTTSPSFRYKTSYPVEDVECVVTSEPVYDPPQPI